VYFVDKYSKIVQNAWYIHQDNTNYAVTDHILVLFVRNISHSRKNWARYCHKRTLIFM